VASERDRDLPLLGVERVEEAICTHLECFSPRLG
jgi:hypothetical protein